MLQRISSYSTGFAPLHYAPRHKSLWVGCNGAWWPGLGPTGPILMDWSGNNNNGTLTGQPVSSAWAIRGGQHSISVPNSTTIYVACKKEPVLFSLTKPFSVVVWFFQLAVGNHDQLLSISTDDTNSFQVNSGSAGGYGGLFSGNASNIVRLAAMNVLTAGLWHCGIIRYNGEGAGTAGNWDYWVDGKPQFPMSAAGGFAALAQQTTIGGANGNAGSALNGNVGLTQTYQRMLTLSEIQLHSQRQGISFDFEWPQRRMFGQKNAAGGATAFPWHYYQQMMAG